MQEDILVQITAKLKDIRKEKNFTLQELAEAAGVTKGMLSQVENNRTIPSLTVFLSIIKSLNVDINHFFQDFTTGEKKVIFKKKSDFKPFEKENRIGFHYQRIFSSTVDDYHLDFVLLTLQPDAQSSYVETDAYEFKYLISGNIVYSIGEDNYEMEAGDAIFFDATVPHNPKNIGETEAQLLVIYIFNKPI